MPATGARAALYLRVSTPDQKPDLQFDGLRGYTARAGLEVVRDYCDVAVSGRREGRPQLNALMTAARNHEIDCVLVWKFDRFARSTRTCWWRWRNSTISASGSSAYRIRSTPTAQWDAPCSRSSVPW